MTKEETMACIRAISRIEGMAIGKIDNNEWTEDIDYIYNQLQKQLGHTKNT